MASMTLNDQAFFEMIDGVMEAEAHALGQAIVARAQAIVPIDTGALRDSITYRIEHTGGQWHIIVGAYTDYALFVELGTVRMSAQPYLRPAVDQIVAHIASELQSAIAAYSVAGAPAYSRAA
jgi:HK97 gp10 family phage protein